MSTYRIYISIVSAAAALAPPFLRIALAVPFFLSGLTKWDGFGALSPSATFLFAQEFRLHIFGHAVAFPAPQLFAYASGTMEIALPVLLVLGLATRFSALTLLAMTGVIQLVAPDGWQTYHLPWVAIALALIALGPGRLSFDHFIRRHAFVSGPASAQ